MTQYDNTNKGILSDNKRKTTDNHPDMTGHININGTDHWFSGWWKTKRDDGSSFLSLSIGEVRQPLENRGQSARPQQPSRPQPRPQQSRPPAPAAKGGFDDMDDSDVPFADPMKCKAFCLSV